VLSASCDLECFPIGTSMFPGLWLFVICTWICMGSGTWPEHELELSISWFQPVSRPMMPTQVQTNH